MREGVIVFKKAFVANFFTSQSYHFSNEANIQLFCKKKVFKNVDN